MEWRERVRQEPDQADAVIGRCISPDCETGACAATLRARSHVHQMRAATAQCTMPQAHEHPWLSLGERRSSDAHEAASGAPVAATPTTSDRHKRKSGAKRSPRKSGSEHSVDVTSDEMALLSPTTPGGSTAADVDKSSGFKDIETRAPVSTPV